MTKAIATKLPVVTSEITISDKWLEARDALLVKTAEVTKVAGQEDFEKSTELQNQVTKTSNKLENIRKDIAKPFADAQKIIKKVADDAREPLEKEKKRLKDLNGEYADKQRLEAVAERRRIEQEEREAAERQLAEQRKEQEARDALGMDAAPEKPIEPVIPNPEPTVMAAKSDYAAVPVVLEWDLLDESKVPSAFLSFDARKVNEYKREWNIDLRKKLEDDPASGNTIIPGILFRLRSDVRGAR